MRYTLVFMLTLVLVSGFIAYFGDILGRRMGKRRLTLFGLRPRHTAIVTTTITGMLIAVLTMALMIAVSENLRQVLVRGERMARETRRLESTNFSLRAEASELRKQRNNLHLLKDRAERELRDARAARDQARAARDLALGRIAELSGNIRKATNELDRLRRKGALSARLLAGLESQLGKRQQELASAKLELAERQKDLKEKEKELKNAEEILYPIQREIDQKTARIAELNREIEEQARAAALRERQRDYAVWMFREGDIRFRQGEELARRVINPEPREKIISDLLDVLQEASDYAREGGAAEGRNGRAVRLITVDTARRLIEDDEDKCLGRWADEIYRKRESVVVLVLAAANIVGGEQAIVEFRPYTNRLTFIKNAVIAKAAKPIDGRMSEGRILIEVVKFLQADVRRAAAEARIIPVANEEPQIKDEQLDELLDLVERIRQSDGPVQLVARAERDIWTAGPLDLRSMNLIISPIRTGEKPGGDAVSKGG